MPFDPSQPSTVEEMPTSSGFDPSKPSAVEAPEETAFHAAKAYMQAPGIPEDIHNFQSPAPTLPIGQLGSIAMPSMMGAPDQWPALNPDRPITPQEQAYIDKTAAYHSVNPARVYAGEAGDAIMHPGRTIGQITGAIGNMADQGYQGVVNAAEQGTADVEAHPVLGTLRSGLNAAAGGVYGIINGIGGLLPSAQQKVVNMFRDPVERAREDYRSRVIADEEAAKLESIKTALGQPGTFAIGEQVAPFAFPAVGLEGAGLAAKLGGGIESGINRAVPAVIGRGLQGVGTAGETAATHAGLMGGALGVGSALAHGGLDAASVGELAGGVILQATKPGFAALKNIGQGIAERGANPFTKATSKAIGQTVGAGVNMSAATLTGMLYGYAGAQAGQEGTGGLQGAAVGSLFWPLAIAGGAMTRQGIEQAAKTAEAQQNGERTFNDPIPDEQNARAMESIPPERAALFNGARGFIRDLPTVKGGRTRMFLQTPEDFAPGAEAMNQGQVSNAAGARGYYINGKGDIFLNAAYPDLMAATHEAIHALQETHPLIDPKGAQSLTKSLNNAALVNGNPTPSYQRFLNSYQGREVDWDTLTPDEKASYLREYGAQTGLALGQLTNPGKWMLPREASDVIFEAIGDWARKGGWNPTDITEGLPGQTTEPIPADPEVLRQTRKALRSIGEADRFPDLGNKTTTGKITADRSTPRAKPTVNGIPPTEPTPQVPPTPEPVNPAGGPAVDRNTPAYQNAFAILTLPKKAGGLEMAPADAQARLDAAALHPDVPNTASDYIFFAQEGRARDERATPPGNPPPSTPPVKTEPSESSTSAVPIAPAAEQSVEPTPDSASVAPPTPEEAPAVQSQPEAVGKPREKPSSQNPAPQTQPEPVGAATAVLEAPTGESGIAAPPVESEGNAGSSRELTNAGAEGLEKSPTGISTPETGTDTSAPKESHPQPTSEPAPAPLSADEIARIRSEVAAAHQPNPYPRTAPEKRAQKQAQDLSDAQRKAVEDAHAAAVPPGDKRAKLRIDPVDGSRKVIGSYLDPSDPLHAEILDGLDDASRSHLDAIQRAIASGTPVNMDYASAPEGRTQQTAQQRREAQRASTAEDRATGEALHQEADKEFYPFAVEITQKGRVVARGFSPDKLVGNGKKLLDYFIASGLRLPYSDVNDPRFIADVAGYNRNHANGVDGQGTKQLIATEGVPVPETPADYRPYQMTKDRADFVNALMANESAQGKRNTKKSQAIRDFARANGIEPDEAGEVNALRKALNSEGFGQGPDSGTGKVLESPFETIRVDDIISTKPSTGQPPEFTNLRAQAFRGDRGQLTAEGLPNNKFAGAGFMPGDVKAGETIPGTTAKAAEDLPVREYGNATVTGLGTQFMPASHGTPYDVDRFSTDKIGTGEGAQAYGYGLYFAENPSVAVEYARNLSRSALFTKNGEMFDDRSFLRNINVRSVLNTTGGDIDAAIARGRDVLKNSPGTQGAEFAKSDISILQKLKAEGGLSKKSGNLYTVDLDVDHDHLLDWDKPLSEQSDYVKKAIASITPAPAFRVIQDSKGTWNIQGPKGFVMREGYGEKTREEAEATLPNYETGFESVSKNLYQDLSTRMGGLRSASEALNKAGIPGIRYLDQGSRFASPANPDFHIHPVMGGTWEATKMENGRISKEVVKKFDTIEQAHEWMNDQPDTVRPTHNFVMFDDSKIRITHKNGEPVETNANFLPASSAGASPEEVANAEKLWKEKGVESPYFMNWFQGSKIVDRDGLPLTVSHGTNKNFEAFDTSHGAFFSRSKETSGSYGRRQVDAYLSLKNPAEWGTDLLRGFQDFLVNAREEDYSPRVIKDFNKSAKRSDSEQGADAMDSYVLAVLRQRPERLTFSDTDPIFGLLKEYLMNKGYDGLIRPYEISDNVKTGDMEYIPFHPDQIKAASNRGTFDPKDPRINFMPGGEASSLGKDEVRLPEWQAGARERRLSKKIVQLRQSIEPVSRHLSQMRSILIDNGGDPFLFPGLTSKFIKDQFLMEKANYIRPSLGEIFDYKGNKAWVSEDGQRVHWEGMRSWEPNGDPVSWIDNRLIMSRAIRRLGDVIVNEEANLYLAEQEDAGRTGSQAAKESAGEWARRTKAAEFAALLDARDAESARAGQSFVSKIWNAFGKHDETFQYGRTDSNSADDIAKAVSAPGRPMHADYRGETVHFHGKEGSLTIYDADTKRPYIRSSGANSQGKKQGGGAQLYAAALDWIHNNGKKIKDDEAGITDINAVRRTSNFLASAVRWGTTKHLEPHDKQGIQWTKSDTLNTAALATTEMGHAFKAVAPARNWSYDFDSGKFRDDAGKNISRAKFEAAVSAGDPGESGVGLSTLQRAIITNSAIRAFERGDTAGNVLEDAERVGAPAGVSYMPGKEPEQDESGFTSQLAKTIHALPQETMTVKQAAAQLGTYQVERTTVDGSGKKRTEVLGTYGPLDKSQADKLAQESGAMVKWQSQKGIKEDEINHVGILTDPLSPLVGKTDNEKVTRSQLLDFSTERAAKTVPVALGQGREWHVSDDNSTEVFQTEREAEQAAENWRENYMDIAMADGAFDYTVGPSEYEDGEFAVYDHRGDEVASFGTEEEARNRAQRMREKAEEDVKNAVNVSEEEKNETQFSSYQLPGADPDTYREAFVTRPQKRVWLDGSPVTQEDLSTQHGRDTANRVSRAGEGEPNWQDGHSDYSDVTNPIVRLRYNIRTDATGKKTLFLEEIQGPQPDEQAKMPDFLRKRIYDIGMKRALRLASSMDEGAALREIRKPQSVRELSKNLFGGEASASLPPLDIVDGGVLTALQNNKIAKAIVANLPVDVMNNLRSVQWTPNEAFSKLPMRLDDLPAKTRDQVATTIITATRKTLAPARAKLLKALQGRVDEEILPAVKASDLSPREIVGMLAPASFVHLGSVDRGISEGSAAMGAERSRGLTGSNDKRLPATATDFLNTPVVAATHGTESSSRATVGDREGQVTNLANLLDGHNKILSQKHGDSKRNDYELPVTHLGWTTGSQQADRYSLSKFVDEIRNRVRPNGDRVVVIAKGDNDLYQILVDDKGLVTSSEDGGRGSALIGKTLDEIVGKEMAQKILTEPKQATAYKGLDLDIGGTGLKKLYDSDLPRIANAIGKKFNVRTTEEKIQTGKRTGMTMDKFLDWASERNPEISRQQLEWNWKNLGTNDPLVNEYGEEVQHEQIHTFQIPDALREHVQKGQPLFLPGGKSPRPIQKTELPFNLRPLYAPLNQDRKKEKAAP